MDFSQTNHKISLPSRRWTTSYAFETGVHVLDLIPVYKDQGCNYQLTYMRCIYMLLREYLSHHKHGAFMTLTTSSWDMTHMFDINVMLNCCDVSDYYINWCLDMITSSSGNISTLLALWAGNPSVSGAEFWCFLWCAPEQTVEQTVKVPEIWDVMTSMWRHCNESAPFTPNQKWISDTCMFILIIYIWQRFVINFVFFWWWVAEAIWIYSNKTHKF